jgi:NAD(P)-dependent dehydrogenase (short-subunit alcohol dehydrogenase family)
MQLNESVALVTGANRGIGRAFVQALLDRGTPRVYAAARQPATLEELVTTQSGRVIPVQLDITDPAQVKTAAEQARDVTTLVNNAGSAAFDDLLSGDLASIEHDMQTNFFGTLEVSRAFAPVLEDNGGGAIITMLTVAALASAPALGGYCASKAAAYSMTQALRAQLAPKGITIHGVFPGVVDTDMSRTVPVPKVSAAEVAQAALDAVEAGEEDIFPDAMARDGYALWLKDRKALERQLATLGS